MTMRNAGWKRKGRICLSLVKGWADRTDSTYCISAIDKNAQNFYEALWNEWQCWKNGYQQKFVEFRENCWVTLLKKYYIWVLRKVPWSPLGWISWGDGSKGIFFHEKKIHSWKQYPDSECWVDLREQRKGKAEEGTSWTEAEKEKESKRRRGAKRKKEEQKERESKEKETTKSSKEIKYQLLPLQRQSRLPKRTNPRCEL